jgi:hypothetical protein
MKSIRRVVAMTLVATALCADRAVIAAPAGGAQTPATVGITNRTLVARLTVSLRRCVPGLRMVAVRRDQDRPAIIPSLAAQTPLFEAVSLSPFQFRLPPPLPA